MNLDQLLLYVPLQVISCSQSQIFEDLSVIFVFSIQLSQIH